MVVTIVTDQTESNEDDSSEEEDEDEDGQEEEQAREEEQEQEGEEQEGEEQDVGEETGDWQEAVEQERDDEEDKDEQASNPTSHSFTNLFHSRLLQAPPPALYHPLAPRFSLLPLTSLPLPPSPSPPRLRRKHLPDPSHPPHASMQHTRREPPQEVQRRGRVEPWQKNQQRRQQQRRPRLLRYALSSIRLLF